MNLSTTRRSNATSHLFLLLTLSLLSLTWQACIHTDPDLKPTSLVLSQHELTLAVQDSVRLSYQLQPDQAVGQVEWKSTNPDVLTVDRRGYVRTLSIGEALVIASCGECRDTCRVYVKSYWETIRFTGAAIAGEPDTLYYGGKIYNAKMGGKDVKVYKALLTLNIMSEGLYLNEDGELSGALRGAIITIKAPIFYGTKSLNGGKSVGNIVDRYQVASPYTDELHTFEAASIDAEAYVGAMTEWVRCINENDALAHVWTDSAARCIRGATLSLAYYRSVNDGAASDGYELSQLPDALLVEGDFTLTTNGVTSMMYGLKNSRLVVKPFADGTHHGVSISESAGAYSLLDHDLHFEESVTFTY